MTAPLVSRGTTATAHVSDRTDNKGASGRLEIQWILPRLDLRNSPGIP